jgi:hypothetical protein
MRIVARDAGQPQLAGPIAFGEPHQLVVIEQRGVGASSSRQRHFKNRQRVVQGSSRTKVKEVLSWLQHPCVRLLVTLHADVVGKPAWQPSRIHDTEVCAATRGRALCASRHVQLAWSMTPFAADGQFLEGRLLE